MIGNSADAVGPDLQIDYNRLPLSRGIAHILAQGRKVLVGELVELRHSVRNQRAVSDHGGEGSGFQDSGRGAQIGRVARRDDTDTVTHRAMAGENGRAFLR